jgi:hypothetical protein
VSNGTTPSPPGRELLPYAEEIKARSEQMRHTDRAAVDIGLTALNAAILVNAGSLVALLALSGQLWKDDHGTAMKVLTNSHYFVWGLVLAVGTAGVSYIYQSLMTRLEGRVLGQMLERNAPPSRTLKVWLKSIAAIMLALAAGSYAMFVIGAMSIANALQS